MSTPRPLPWLDPGDPFPPAERAWGRRDPIPGLLAAGGALDTPTLLQAYRHGVFPWYGEGQPILWWSPDPRMVLRPSRFHLSHSLRKALRAALRQGRLQIRMDSAFDAVIDACAHTPRPGQDGTWIVPEMQAAYRGLHRAGHAHSVETWWDGQLVGGLYLVNIGRAVFGESMFSHRPDASKMALAALVAACRAWGVPLIDCQQNTRHLASLGAAEESRDRFLHEVRQAIDAPTPAWRWDCLYWNCLWPDAPLDPLPPTIPSTPP
ncbi:Leucyl/phenylalanyl-tRNA--protein transferase [Tepidimonas fonticaldi]|uniref:Leucyl/phenylalanyl-tRNA--protein transferase n=1 Tax=Tepidimonas fonticaldi TaxID=1101373 RepID=A0A1A6DUX3_9BURK|nr:leucyl/phenylalanyl-tRNA--protein transferase [Tepidimonas fonticaldi]OBS30722.1 leucyl/phenylalanyl-tRNA--protein transferase [Tepidimonas fonticaldi]TSE37610.1 Leucyl/phenylalanyl-tRNA--protein transferase [Tepidimonas fonticaldi]